MDSNFSSVISWDNYCKVILISLLGNFDKQSIAIQLSQIEQAILDHPSPVVKCLFNLSQFKLLTIPAQVLFSEFIRSKTTHRIAFTGMTKFTQSMLSMVVELSETHDLVRFFDTEAEALAWLDGE